MADGATRTVTESDLPRVRAFLESQLETSLFLLSNLHEHGLRLTDQPNSGNLRCYEDGDGIGAVFSLTRRGNLILQTGGRSDLAATIVKVCQFEPMRIEGVIGGWSGAASIWEQLTADPRFQPGFQSQEILYRLDLTESGHATRQENETSGPPSFDPASLLASPTTTSGLGAIRARLLEVEDFEQSDRLSTAFLLEEGMPAQIPLERRRDGFRGRIGARHLWGVFDQTELVAIAGLNASYHEVGQVGGVYTTPPRRRQGLQRLAMETLIRDARSLLGHQLLVLFTGQTNLAAQRLYESLGFTRIGYFGLLFGTWKPS